MSLKVQNKVFVWSHQWLSALGGLRSYYITIYNFILSTLLNEYKYVTIHILKFNIVCSLIMVLLKYNNI